jgi:hypothetical protein
LEVLKVSNQGGCCTFCQQYSTCVIKVGAVFEWEDGQTLHGTPKAQSAINLCVLHMRAGGIVLKRWMSFLQIVSQENAGASEFQSEDFKRAPLTTGF